MVSANQIQKSEPVTININPIALKFTLLGAGLVALLVGAPFLIEFMWNNFMSYAFGLPVFTYVNAVAMLLTIVSVVLLIVGTVVALKELT